MKLMLVFAMIVLNYHSDNADYLSINQHGEPIALVNRSHFINPIEIFPFVNEKKLVEFEDELAGKVKLEPINAGLDYYGNIIPERPGARLNRRLFAEQFYTYFYGNGPRAIEVPVQVLSPRVDSELISDIRTVLIGHYVTFYNRNNKPRSHNISLATSFLNNYVVFPGETFSFNKVVGNRTKAKGYLSAPIIVKGELSEGIGGGICQVSSTLYNAADGSGLEILERYSHSKRVAYVPSGRDATVSWYGPDFTFKNKYNQPILIRAQAREGKMIVLIFSSDVINSKPRIIPRMSSKLPKEIPASN